MQIFQEHDKESVFFRDTFRGVNDIAILSKKFQGRTLGKNFQGRILGKSF